MIYIYIKKNKKNWDIYIYNQYLENIKLKHIIYFIANILYW